MGYITGWIVVGIITLGIYKLFELFLSKKDPLTKIQKFQKNLKNNKLSNRKNMKLTVGNHFM